MVGETFGNYEVVATLGKGGVGVVYLAQHHTIARRAAVKVLAPELSKDRDVVKRFFVEALATSLIHHPGIVEVYDYDVESSGRAYIVMEYLDGETLAECLERTRHALLADRVRDRAADRVGGRRRARARRRPPRSEAGERVRLARRGIVQRDRAADQGARLRAGEAARRRSRE